MAMVSAHHERYTGSLKVVEYYHAEFDHYFLTSTAEEIDKLDNGFFAGWARTGQSFEVYPVGTAGTADVCRFFSASFAPKSTHFYTTDVAECALRKQEGLWKYEGLSFALTLPDGSGNCVFGLTPLYRLYNNGQGGAPNHRYTISPAIRIAMIDHGWIPEGAGVGVIGCVMPGAVTNSDIVVDAK